MEVYLTLTITFDITVEGTRLCMIMVVLYYTDGDFDLRLKLPPIRVCQFPFLKYKVVTLT